MINESAHGLVSRMSNDSLKTRLKQLNMTKSDLARALGLSEGTVHNWKDTPPYADAYLGLIEETGKAMELAKYIEEKWK